MSGTCLVRVWYVYGNGLYVSGACKYVYDACLERFLHVPFTCLVRVLYVSGTCLKRVLYVSGTSLVHV